MTDKQKGKESALDIATRREQEVADRKASKAEEEGIKVASIELPDTFDVPAQLELFALEILDFEFSLKDEIDGMTLPIFAINQKSQQDKLYTWIRHDGKVKMRVEAVAGRPTQHDKDLVIFVISALMHEYNVSGKVPDVIDMHTRHYLIGTDRQVGGSQYSQFEGTLKRIQHMTVVVDTDNDDGTKTINKQFAYFTGSEVIVKSKTDQVLAVRLKISDWLKGQISNKNVLTMNRDYFKLSGSLERRLYEIARKHCGRQGLWRVTLPVLCNMTGSASTLKLFKQQLGRIIEADSIPDYRLSIAGGKKLADTMIEIYSKDAKELLKLL